MTWTSPKSSHVNWRPILALCRMKMGQWYKQQVNHLWSIVWELKLTHEYGSSNHNHCWCVSIFVDCYMAIKRFNGQSFHSIQIFGQIFSLIESYTSHHGHGQVQRLLPKTSWEKNMANWLHKFCLNPPIFSRAHVLKCTHNKHQLNGLIYLGVMDDTRIPYM